MRVLLCVLCAAASVDATAIVVFRQADRIVFAGDSVFTITPYDGRAPTRVRACKVRQAGRWAFVLGGFTNHDTGTDTYTLVARAIAPTRTVRDALMAIAAGERPIYDLLTSGYRANPTADPPMLHVIVGGIDGGQMVVGIYTVEMKRREPFELMTGAATCPGAWCPGDQKIFYSASVGANGPAVKLMTTTPRPPWLQRGDAAAARRLITLQSAATPALVGPPIDVLEITTSGARWIQRDPASLCAQEKS